MKVFNHVFHTWLLAQFFHFIIFSCYFAFILCDPLSIGALISLLIGSFMISSPSLFISFFLLNILLRFKASTIVSLITWQVLAIISIVINIFFFSILLGENNLDWKFIFPSFIAALLSILIRFAAFQMLIKQNREYDDQDDIVSTYRQ